jgi:hypothetical protein
MRLRDLKNKRRIIKIKKKQETWMRNLPNELKRKFARRFRNL